MPKPTTQAQLLTEMQKEYDALEEFLTTLTPEQMLAPGAMAHWSPKDVLAHLIAWDDMVLSWYKAGLRGKTLPQPAEGFTWRQLPELNQRIYQEHCDEPLPEVLKQFRAHHRKMLKLVQGLSDEALFTRGRYGWTGKNALASYLIPCTSSHYRWARTEMRKGLKAGKKSR